MTTIAFSDCANCLTRYTWHPSTYGWRPGPENDGRYCPRCKVAILDALEKIAPTAKRDCVDVDVAEDEWNAVVGVWQAERDKEDASFKRSAEPNDDPNSFVLPMRVVPSPMFRFDDAGRTHKASDTWRVTYNDQLYFLTKDYETKQTRIQREMLRDLESGKLRAPARSR